MDLGPVHRIAATQRSLITFDQLLTGGLSRRQIEGLAGSNILVPVHRSVYRLIGSTLTWEAELQAALLAAGPEAWISHRSALAWWGLPRRETEVVELVTTDARRRRLAGVRAHQTVDLPAADRRRHRGLSVTSIERSLFDAGRYLSPGHVGAALDHAVRDGLTTYQRFQRRVDELGRPGRDGTTTSRRVLSDRGYGDGFGFEKAMRGLLRDAGLPAPVREFRVHVDGHRYRVDFAYPDSMIGIECDSSEWHELFHQREHDLERQNRIQNEGLLLLRYTVARLRSDAAGVGNEIATAIARRAGHSVGPTPTFPDVRPR